MCMERNFWFRAALILLVLSAFVYLATAVGRLWGYLGDLFLIIFFGWLVGSILIHFVSSMMRIPHMRRSLAIILVYLALITLIASFALYVIPATITQVIEISQMTQQYVPKLPNLLGNVDEILNRFSIEIGLQDRFQLESVGALINDAVIWVTEAANAINILQNVVSVLFRVTLVIILSFYIVLDGGSRLNKSLKVLPPKFEAEVRQILRTFDDTFHGYIRGLFIVSLIYGVGTASVMLATGLPAALPTAIMASLFLAVPFLGDWLALALPLLIAALAGDFVTFLIVLTVLLFIQQVMLNLLTPRILGKAVRMPAMLVIISILLGAKTAGVPGALLGVPAAAVFYSLAVTYGQRIIDRRQSESAATQTVRSQSRRSRTVIPPNYEEETGTSSPNPSIDDGPQPTAQGTPTPSNTESSEINVPPIPRTRKTPRPRRQYPPTA
jgi:predicted PurR-regulated permease PerM